jgi:hypothetical protein
MHLVLTHLKKKVIIAFEVINAPEKKPGFVKMACSQEFTEVVCTKQ